MPAALPWGPNAFAKALTVAWSGRWMMYEARLAPYIEGERLRERIDRAPGRRLDAEEALCITREVADALHFAHLHKITALQR